MLPQDLKNYTANPQPFKARFPIIPDSRPCTLFAWLRRYEDRILQAFCLVAGAFVLAALISGCASDSYWTKVREPELALGIVETPSPCGRADYLGCANYATMNIEVKPNLRPVLRECVIKHEMRHFAGYTHEERKGFSTDCGDGTMVNG